MPPKKLSKAEKDRLKQEAERRAQEEEEQRLKEEEERRKKEEEEARQKEEEAQKLKEEEQARFVEERAQYNTLKETQTHEIKEWKRTEKESKEWDHYVSCNRLPLATSQQSLNTYLSTYSEKPPPATITDTMERIKELFQVLQGLEEEIQEEGNETIDQYITKIRGLINKELDDGTLLAMKDPDEHIDSETFNLLLEEQLPSIMTYCLWGNIVKNPRLKEFSFQYCSFTIDLPKSMTMLDVSVRLMCLSYDTLSPLCKTYKCSTTEEAKEQVETSTDDKSVENEVTDATEIEGVKEVETESNTTQDTNNGVTQQSNEVGATTTESTDAPPSEDATPTTNGGDTKVEEDDVVLDEDEVDLRGYTIVGGGPILIDLLVLPPQPKSVNNWIIAQNTMNTLVQSPDLTEPSGALSSISVRMNFPEPYYYPEDETLYQLAQWDENAQSWKQGKLKEVKFDLSNKSVSFVMTKFSPLAILVDIYNNLPYQLWELLPLGTDHTLLHIAGSSIEMSIEIKGSQCMLIRPLEEPAVEGLINKTYTTTSLIKALKCIGFHFFPATDAHKYTSLTDKNREMEEGLYECMSMACGGWGYQWSQWNEKGGQKGAVIQATPINESERASLRDEPNPDKFDSWRLYLSTCEKTLALQSKETGEDFSDELPDGKTTHSNLYTALLSESTPQISELMSLSSPIHIHNVQQWLKATRPVVATC